MNETQKHTPEPWHVDEFRPGDFRAMRPVTGALPEPSNDERAQRAAETLEAYAGHEWTGAADEPRTATVDLLADLLHLWGPSRFDACLSMARMHHETEVTR